MTSNPENSPLRPLMRRMTVLVAIFTAVALGVCFWLNKPLAALGVLIGVGLSVLNLRLLDSQVSRVHIGAEPDKADKKRARNQISRSAGLRLAIVTGAVAVSFMIAKEFSLGVVTGLALSQAVFIANVFRVVTGLRVEEN